MDTKEMGRQYRIVESTNLRKLPNPFEKNTGIAGLGAGVAQQQESLADMLEIMDEHGYDYINTVTNNTDTLSIDARYMHIFRKKRD